MPDGGYWGDNLTQAVTNGSVSSTRLDDMVTRILATWFQLKQNDTSTFPYPSVFNYDNIHPIVDVRGDHASLIREIAAAGTVLVKNVNKALPLKAPRFLNIYGYDATIPTAPWNTSARFGGGYDVNFGWNTFNGTLITAGGSGSNTPSGLITPFQAIQDRVLTDRGTTRWDFVNVNPTVYAAADASIVFINAYASEAFDRTTLQHEWSDELVNNVAAKCNNTIVVVHSAGIRLVDRWIEHPNVTAVVFAMLPGEQSGNSLVDVLHGDVVPSGRLPFTIAKNEEDYGHLLNSSGTALPDPFPQINFTEGLHIDYKWFDSQDIDVRFEFGYGLSYSEFEYGSEVKVVQVGEGSKDEYPAHLAPDDIPQGGSPELWEVVYNVTFSVKNIGDVDAAEIPQLYLAVPDAPKWQLRGFDKVWLKCGEEKVVTLGLTRRDLSIWDVVAQKWRMQKGRYGLFVGASSRDKRIEGEIVVE
jgi:beta-glucosidase